jgi:hypothetical protein
MKTVQTTYDIVLRGHLDPPLLALVAEYDLGDLPAQVMLQGLPADRATLDGLLARAHALGVTIVQVRRVPPRPDNRGPDKRGH